MQDKYNWEEFDKKYPDSDIKAVTEQILEERKTKKDLKAVSELAKAYAEQNDLKIKIITDKKED